MPPGSSRARLWSLLPWFRSRHTNPSRPTTMRPGSCPYPGRSSSFAPSTPRRPDHRGDWTRWPHRPLGVRRFGTERAAETAGGLQGTAEARHHNHDLGMARERSEGARVHRRHRHPRGRNEDALRNHHTGGRRSLAMRRPAHIPTLKWNSGPCKRI